MRQLAEADVIPFARKKSNVPTFAKSLQQATSSKDEADDALIKAYRTLELDILPIAQQNGDRDIVQRVHDLQGLMSKHQQTGGDLARSLIALKKDLEKKGY